jgi:plastocyanin
VNPRVTVFGMKRLMLLLLACLALGLVVAGCGDDDDDDSGGGGGANTEQSANQGGGSGGGGGAEIGMQNIQFDPADVTIKPGETVTWTNDEGVAHDVEKTSGPGPKFSSGPEGGMMEGDTFAHTFDQPGTYEYVCRVHAPGMAGTIEVTN